MAMTELGIVNTALAHLGQSIQFTASGGTIATITSPVTGVAYEQVNLHFDRCRGRMEQDFNYPRLTKFVRLVLNDTAEASDTWFSEYAYAYTYPTAARVRKIVTGGGPMDPVAIPFKLGQHGGAQVIFTDMKLTDAVGDYLNVEITDPSTSVSYFDECFADALSFDLACAMAPAMGKSLEERKELDVKRAESMSRAQRASITEGYWKDEDGGPYVTGRGGG